MPNFKGGAGGGPGIDLGQAGFYTPAHGPWGGGTSVPVANRMYMIRFVCPRSQTITRLSFVTTVAATVNDNCDVAIYNQGLTSLLGSAGSTAGKLNATAGVQTVNLLAAVALQQGTIYYAAFAYGPVGGTAATMTMAALTGGSNAGSCFGATAGLIEQAFMDAAFPCPASATVGAVTSVPLLALRQ